MFYIFFSCFKKVFEVNCSSQRSGCHIVSQLKEATQSHLVEMSGKDPLKPTYFNHYSSTPKSEGLSGGTLFKYITRVLGLACTKDCLLKMLKR